MKRWMAGLCGAVLGGTVQAQTSVILYGVADANIEYTTHNATSTGGSGSRVAMQSGGLAGSRFGFRGTEDLGGGMQTLFALESAIAIDNGTLQQGGRLWGRQAFVGLSAPYGKLTFGRQYTSLFDLNASYSPTAYATQFEPVVFMLGTSLREDNMVKYTGNFGPVTLETHWAFGEQAGSATSGSGWGGGASYRANGLGVQVSYDQVDGTRTAGSTPKTQKVAVAGRYEWGPASLFAGYRFGKSDSTAARTVALDNFWWLGGIYRTGALSLTLVYYYDDLRTYRPTATTTSSQANPRQWLFVVDYDLSKRTDVYLSAAYSRYSALNFDTYNGPAASYVMANGSSSQLGAAIGMRHRF
ncbi:MULTISPECIES: porin [unclassified Cupriavidus]|uniref:porin n=1 Tax=unclassified Cupriavidus TaxID=2640874 RepID=UPI00049047DC|nr:MULTISPECIES: porin [unclassified Cupriavidus]MBP0633147.1 porin [Cupriavidus sp. AcVe19-1a]